MSQQSTSSAGVVLRGVHKSFGSIQAVRGVDISITPGETVAILGPNGAGKSTTIDMLLGLSQPDQGSVTLFGLSPDEAVAQGRVGAMLQVGSLIRDLNVIELVRMVASLYPNPLGVDEVLERTKTTALANRRTQKLSGGESQRVRFALALISNPDLLILDEPTVALDVESRHQFWTVMREIAAGGKTVVFATHYLGEADSYADRIVLMAHGLIVADGSTTEIKGRVGSRSIHATLPDANPTTLEAITGVTSAEVHGEAVHLRCEDADAAIRQFLNQYPSARNIEVMGADLDEAFMELTSDPTEASK